MSNNSDGCPDLEMARDSSDHGHGNYILPNLVLVEIFLRLPLKSIFRLQSVCKHWFSLLRDPHFNKQYALRSKDSPYSSLILVGPDPRDEKHFVSSNHHLFSSPTFPIPFPYSSIPKIVGSSGDLILIKTHTLDVFPTFHVCDPFTREWVAFHVFDPLTREWIKQGHDMGEKWRIRGISFIARVKDGIPTYRVVLITSFRFVDCCPVICFAVDGPVFNIFSSETGDWAVHELMLPLTGHSNRLFDQDMSINHMGYIHWADISAGFLLACDPYHDGPWYRYITLPTAKKGNCTEDKDTIVGTCQGCLMFFKMSGTVVENHLFPGWNLYVFNNDYDKAKWTLIQNADKRPVPPLSEPLCSKLDLSGAFRPVAFDPYLKDIVYYFLQVGYIFTFNMKKGWFEDEYVSTSHMCSLRSVKAFTVLAPQCLPVQDQQQRQRLFSKPTEAGIFQSIGRHVINKMFPKKVILPPSLFETCDTRKMITGLFR